MKILLGLLLCSVYSLAYEFYLYYLDFIFLQFTIYAGDVDNNSASMNLFPHFRIKHHHGRGFWWSTEFNRGVLSLLFRLTSVLCVSWYSNIVMWFPWKQPCSEVVNYFRLLEYFGDLKPLIWESFKNRFSQLNELIIDHWVFKLQTRVAIYGANL